MNKKILLISVLGLAAATVGCSKKETTDSPSVSYSAATSAFMSADKLLAASVPASAGAASVTSTSLLAGFVPDSSTYCAPSGSPLALGSEAGSNHTDNGITSKYLDESGQEVLYGRRFWWCMVNHPSAGPDTVRGSIMKIKGFMCELDRATGSGFVFDGASHTATIGISSTCFTDEFIAMASGAGISSIDMTYTASTTPSAIFSGASDTAWTHAINISLGAVGIQYKILLKMPTDQSEVAGMVQQTQNSQTDAYGFDMAYSGANATIRYEGRFDGYSDGTTNTWKRHIRTIATGIYSGDGGFSSITSAKGVYANVYRNSGSTSFSVRTVSADSTGIKTDTYTGSATDFGSIPSNLTSATGYAHGDNACYSGCSLPALLTVGANSKNFIALTTAASSTSVFPQLAPLSFSTLDLTADLP